ncbi:aminoacyl-tRNA hydrolase [Eubacteriales bacterium OttesenSCG-928-K08]|nr:aminoacyl-tRNA hydrolase [Eubacteriales bacterium OttesenSCG-928-K08]
MHLVVGLGNPGIAYRKSRHNAGFMALDQIADEAGISVNKRAHKALIGEGRFGGQRVLLAKPQTYMNLSGEAVQALLHYYKLPVEKLIVLYDDIDLPVGGLRIRANGSAGTHNGMRSIIANLGGDQNFARVRIGVGKQLLGRDLASHVLSKPSADERMLLEDAYKNAADAVRLLLEGDIMGAQAKYNSKKKNPETEA